VLNQIGSFYSIANHVSYIIGVYRVAPKSKLLHFDQIFVKYWPIFLHFYYKLCKKFVTRWHAHLTYCVATLPCKT